MSTVNQIPTRFGKTPTIGVLVDWIGDPYQCGVLAGLLEGLKPVGATLLCFAGGPLPKDRDSVARHRVFELVGPRSVDGVVILASSLGHQIGIQGVAAYCSEHFGGLPLCSVGAPLPGFPSVTTNNTFGMRSLVSHLIGEHGRRRIAFVRGPMANNEAETRFQTYVETLREHQLDYDERFLAIGDFLAPSGQAAVQQFVRTFGSNLKDLDAIIASNDGMALGVMGELERQGIEVPTQMAVTGFDDIEDASLSVPPLTTARQALAKMGRTAARAVLEWSQTASVSSNEEINTELVIRKSCGCAGHIEEIHLSVDSEGMRFEAALLMRRQQIFDALTRVARGELGIAGKDWQAKLLNAFVEDLGAEKSNKLRCLIEEWTEKLLLRTSNMQPCRDALNCLRVQLIKTLRGDATRHERAEDIFYSANLALGEVAARGLQRERTRLGRWVRSIGVTYTAVSNATSLSDLEERMGSSLPFVGLDNYYAVIYPNHDPTTARLLVAHDQAGEGVAPSREPFDARQLLPTPMLKVLQGRAFAVLPLALRNLSLGHILLELNLDSATSYDAMADAIANGLHSALLVGERS